jgi:hypothetical protein
MAETKPADFPGSCLCGAVTFRVTPPTLWCAHCHCTMCQRAHGAAFVTWVGVAAGRVTIDERGLRWHASSPQAERGFCTTCGSTLFFRSERWRDEVHIVRANFHGEIDREPGAHVFYASHVPWFTVGDALPRLPET